MKYENQKKIEAIIESVMRDENDAREKELQAAKEKIKVLNSNATGLREQIIKLSRFQGLLKSLEARTECYVCPNCNGDGGRDDGEGGGEECDYCSGTSFVEKHLLNKWNTDHAPKVQTIPSVVDTQDEEQLPF